MDKVKKKKYTVRNKQKCYSLKCFTPFSGNGQKICRLYELGKCPNDQKEKVN